MVAGPSAFASSSYISELIQSGPDMTFPSYGYSSDGGMSYASAITSLNGSNLDMQRPLGIVMPGLRLSVPWQPSLMSSGRVGLEFSGLIEATSKDSFRAD